MRPALTARALFEIEQKEGIVSLAQAKAEAAQSNRVLPFYQPSVKELFDKLSEAAKAGLASKAVALKNDVAMNQAGFTNGIWGDMNDFVKTGLFGDMTITIMYSCRTPSNSLVRGQ